MTEPDPPKPAATKPPSAGTPSVGTPATAAPSRPPPAFTPHFAVPAAEARAFGAPWLIGGAALILALAAGFVLLGGASVPVDAARSAVDAPPAETAAPSPPAAPTKVELLPPTPLDLTGLSIDARGRGDAWNRESDLSAIRLTIDDGKPMGALEFVFGVPRGPSLPAAVLKPERFAVSYEAGAASTSESKSPALGYALSEPNCPLAAAFRQVTQAGMDPKSRVSVEYLHSVKHGRGVWTFSPPGGSPRSVDADNCAILVR